MPLSAAAAADQGDIERIERPHLKCPGCGQAYRWRDAAAGVLKAK